MKTKLQEYLRREEIKKRVQLVILWDIFKAAIELLTTFNMANVSMLLLSIIIDVPTVLFVAHMIPFIGKVLDKIYDLGAILFTKVKRLVISIVRK